MTERIKIVYVGAGSAVWALRTIRDLIVSKELSSSEIVLVDLDQKRLDYSYQLAERYNRAARGRLKIEKSDNIEQVLGDSDFIINTVLAGGGHRLQEKVREVSEKHGYYRGIESTEFNMVSDYATTFAGYGQLKYVFELQKRIHDLCPDAWLFNIANPMFELQTLLVRGNMIKSVSYCDGTLHYRQIAEFFGLDPDKIDFQMAGLNHNLWLTKLRYHDEDQYPRIEDWSRNKSADYWQHEEYYRQFVDNMPISEISRNVQFSRVSVDMYKTYGLFPVGDIVRSGTWKYHYDLRTKQKWYGPYGGFDSEIGWGAYLKQLEVNNMRIRELSDKSNSEILNDIPMVKGHDPTVPFIEAIAFGRKTRAHLNVRNDDIIQGLPGDIAVEVPVVVDKRGIHPERIIGLNDRIVKEFFTPRMTNMELALDAFFSGDRNVLMEIISRDRRTKSNEQAETLLKDVLNIPENASAKKHYR